MRKFLFALTLIYLFLTSCTSKKEYAALEAKNKETQDLLNTATIKLNNSLEENESLKKTNEELISRINESMVLTSPIEYLIEFCCSNHNPSHCATKIKEMKNLCIQYKCVFK